MYTAHTYINLQNLIYELDILSMIEQQVSDEHIPTNPDVSTAALLDSDMSRIEIRKKYCGSPQNKIN